MSLKYQNLDWFIEISCSYKSSSFKRKALAVLSLIWLAEEMLYKLSCRPWLWCFVVRRLRRASVFSQILPIHERLMIAFHAVKIAFNSREKQKKRIGVCRAATKQKCEVALMNYSVRKYSNIPYG